MVKAVDFQATQAGLPVLQGRGTEMPVERDTEAFATLVAFSRSSKELA